MIRLSTFQRQIINCGKNETPFIINAVFRFTFAPINFTHPVAYESLQPSVWFVGCYCAPFVNQWLVASKKSNLSIYSCGSCYLYMIYNMVATCLVSDV